MERDTGGHAGFAPLAGAVEDDAGSGGLEEGFLGRFEGEAQALTDECRDVELVTIGDERREVGVRHFGPSRGGRDLRGF